MVVSILQHKCCEHEASVMSPGLSFLAKLAQRSTVLTHSLFKTLKYWHHGLETELRNIN